MFPRTEIFSKRRKIYTICVETRVPILSRRENDTQGKEPFVSALSFEYSPTLHTGATNDRCGVTELLKCKITATINKRPLSSVG